VCKFDAGSVFDLLNSHVQKHMLNNPIEIQMQSTLQEGVEPEPKERTVPFSHLTKRLGLIEVGIKFF
jgi:hypothetical protein